MNFENIIFELSLIFGGASLLATLFLFLKQPIILAYIALGTLVGPWGLNYIENASEIEHLSHFGVILLLFLLGLHLQPGKLLLLFKKTAFTSIFVALASLIILGGIAYLFHFSATDSLLIGASLTFSSTVIALKLIPTSTLHHKHKGELMTSVLLFQDILAIILILFVTSKSDASPYLLVPFLIGKVIAISLGAFIVVKYLLLALFKKFDIIQEYIFVVSLGWSLIMAEIASLIGLSYEMGAFIAGVSIASSPIAWVIAEHLKSLREFFLILFFFSIGANFDYLVTAQVIIPGTIITLTLLVIKPLAFKWGFQRGGEKPEVATELGLRLGQASEFSILVATAAISLQKISERASYLIQFVAIMTFVISTYIVINRYHTPISAAPTKK
jgi:Kef-type K+ transport system membrane component KefB